MSQTNRSKRAGVKSQERFDTTSCRSGVYGQMIHRDYAAHFFRWGFAQRFINNRTTVLDVGCGVDCSLARSVRMPMKHVPKRYLGVDYNKEPRSFPRNSWAEFLWEFDFLKDGKKLPTFDLVTCFEVIEHMSKRDGGKLLAALRDRLKPGGKLLLSTPVFNGKKAVNHIHEWEIEELSEAVAKQGLTVIKRFGTFASEKDLKRAASPEHLKTVRQLSEYYGNEVVACFLAPLYPDVSRNNVWLLERS